MLKVISSLFPRHRGTTGNPSGEMIGVEPTWLRVMFRCRDCGKRTMRHPATKLDTRKLPHDTNRNCEYCGGPIFQTGKEERTEKDRMQTMRNELSNPPARSGLRGGFG